MTDRYVAFDLRSGVQLGEVPLGPVQYAKRLFADYTLTARVDLAERTQGGTSMGRYYRDMLQPGRTKLCVVPDEGAPTSFIVWNRSYDGRFLSIDCAGIWSYFARYPLTVYKSYADEQLNTARDLLIWVQAQAWSNIKMAYDWSNSGVDLEIAFQASDRRMVGEAISEMAASYPGFEYSVESSGGVAGVLDVWTPHYPRQGKSAAENEVSIVLSKLSARLSLSEGPPPTRVSLVGAGEGDTMVIATATANSLLSKGYPQLPVDVSFKSETSQGVLNSRVGGELLSLLRRAKVWELSGVYEARPEWQVGLGDEVQIIVPAGTDLLYPEGFTITQRVIGRIISVALNGTKTITLELGEAESTAPVIPALPSTEVATYRVVGTGDSILAMSWGFGSPGGVILNAERWLDFEHGRGPFNKGLGNRYSTAEIWTDLVARSEPDGWAVFQDNSLGPTDDEWAQFMVTVRDQLPTNRNLVAVIPGFLASVSASTSATIATRAAALVSVLGGHPRVNFVDLASYMNANPGQFVDGQHPDATAGAWIKAQIEGLTG